MSPSNEPVTNPLRSLKPLALFTGLIFGLTARSASAQTYTYVPLTDPAAYTQGPYSGTTATGINNAGQIVGYYYHIGYYGFLYTPGAGFTTVEHPAGPGYTFAEGINNAGQIVGQYGDGTTKYGFLYTPGAGFRTISPPAAKYGTTATGINDSGLVAGQYQDYSANHVFLYTPDSGVTPLTDPPPGPGTLAGGINNAGQVVGAFQNPLSQVGFLYTPGTISRVITFPNAYQTLPHGLNNVGQIVGDYYDNGRVGHGFVYTPGLGFTALDDPAALAGTTRALGVNDLGQIVGSYEDTVGLHGFLATASPPVLASLTFPSPVPGGTVVTATVMLNGSAATDMVVGLSSSDSSVVRLHRAVIIPAGSSSATFPINTFRSHVTKTVTITATLGAMVQAQDLTINGR